MVRSLLLLFALTCCLAAPAHADRDWPGERYWPGSPRAYSDRDPFRGLGVARDRHCPQHPRWHAFQGPRVRVLPGYKVAPAFEPPMRFAYYCNDPPGYFPAVPACAGPWMETGAAPQP